jgi:KaiC/GvpD/RAD55 family RecA-like ATPase
LNLASALFKRILEEEDFDTWSNLRRHYLPSEYHNVYDAIDKQVGQYHKLPSLEELKLAIRDAATLDKIYAIEAVEVDAEPFLLLDYLKNEFTQQEALFHLHRYVENSISFETAEETIESLYSIISNIEDKVELGNPEESMQRINLFESDDEILSYIPLGLNTEFDNLVRFKSSDYILMGGKRGSGKSITCSNIANTVYNSGKSVLYFSIEMPTREILQRQVAIGASVPHSKIKYKTLDNLEWFRVARWWANRYENGEDHLEAYKKHHDFNRFHTALQKEPLKAVQLDIIYDPSLTLTKLKAEIIKRVRKLGNVGLVIVDYVNQVKKSSNTNDKFDWKDQISVSTALKELAGMLQVPFFSPYQIDAEGEARFAKGILDSADAAFILEAGPESMSFTCTKIRGDAKVNFTSRVEWNTLTIGPDNGVEIKIEEDSPNRKKGGKTSFKVEEDTKPIMDSIYDDNPF